MVFAQTSTFLMAIQKFKFLRWWCRETSKVDSTNLNSNALTTDILKWQQAYKVIDAIHARHTPDEQATQNTTTTVA
ncbi:MAG: hypothetical protein JWN50_284 [Parcubacteria group bacterium]|nr:hypothetical protein [Parcubacteria group bacterium]